ncbi:hypothetical protein L211DRAFT_777647 [Terfezia boudieri ATCC MYA-4762]|uniref:JmjC domain-containing protein n=1 Tax=Terfezia boudieri ATCC MYA-4762 TaxID=1051890 RepID=A0A3N4M4Z4_9PEZI|nr:hypothetical protein L211DRAFT_777647 [Terfezia boudieri ATCC MYA-4762]
MPPGRNIERPERAEFKPLSPDIDILHLIQSTPNFEHVTRIDARNVNSDTMSDVEGYIHDHVIKKGLPLVIENWHLRSDWSSWIFNVQWLIQNHGQDRINVRDLKNQADIPMSFGHYLSNLRKLASKFHPNHFDGQGKQQRLYGKDLDCPPIWRQTLSDLLPLSTFYLSPIADLMSSLPEPARAENMMCYVGHEGTYTPAHKEMCASLGQNIMIATSEEDELPANRVGAAGREGSSVWFMMGREDREVIAEYWLAQLGHDLEVEKHFASVEDLANAPFTVYIVEQKLGDYILVPPLAPHQVWNRGEYTIKAAWNRTTVDTLEFALNEALPKARLVCRDEQYKNRAIIHETLCKYMRVLKSNNDIQSPDYIKGLPSRKALASDFVRLFNLFNTILLDQYFEVPSKGKEKSETKVEKIDNEYNVTCSFCRANIWNRFLSCGWCVVQGEDGDEDCYDVCIDCYARGRSCGCQSGLKWVEQEDWNGLLGKHEVFRNMVIEIQGAVSAQSPKKFYDALAELPRKTVARVCHEQNKVRPFIDVTKDPALESDDDTATINAKKKSGQLLICHVCKVRHEAWKSAACTSPGCSKSYCYGNLWRAFDMDPCDDVLVKFNWKCPVCLGICSCGACQKNPKMKPHHPRGTFLGADTKHFVDPRSVEVLVDFRRGNLSWLKPGEVDPMARLKRKRSVEEDGDVSMDDGQARYFSAHTWSAVNNQGNAVDDGAAPHVPIDPALSTSDDGFGSEANGHTAPHAAPEDKNMNNGRHSEHDGSLPSGGKPGGGQYTLSPKSSSNVIPPFCFNPYYSISCQGHPTNPSFFPLAASSRQKNHTDKPGLKNGRKQTARRGGRRYQG